MNYHMWVIICVDDIAGRVLSVVSGRVGPV